MVSAELILCRGNLRSIVQEFKVCFYYISREMNVKGFRKNKNKNQKWKNEKIEKQKIEKQNQV